MFERHVPQLSSAIAPALHAASTAASWSGVGRAISYRGPERRGGAALMARLMALALDEIDYGMVMVGQDRRVLHSNHAARLELRSEHPLQLDGGMLHARLPQDEDALFDAMQAASRRSLRRLITLGEGAQRTSISVVPLPALAGDGMGHATLLVLGKSEVCGALSVQGFARAHRLSPGEEQVLSGLCAGHTPMEVAAAHGVAISTVRTQIANIRAKTGTDSIRDLIQQVAVLPPLVGALRSGSDAQGSQGGRTRPGSVAAEYLSSLQAGSN